MCKTSQPKPGNGVLARMRHLKGQIPSPMGDDSARQAGESWLELVLQFLQFNLQKFE